MNSIRPIPALLLLALGLQVLLLQVRSQVDRTREEGGKGSALVEAVLGQLHDACVYPEDGQLLRRLAYVETRDGADPDTYRGPGLGGIWKVDQSMLQRTQTERDRLAVQYDLIKNKLGIDWTTVTWADMRKPLFSALAAAMILTLEGSPVTVPSTVEDQGVFWLTHYRHGNTGLTLQNFTEPVKSLQQFCARTENMDLLFVVDVGGGVGPTQWSSIVKFIDNIVISLDLHNGIRPDKDRVAMITYSDEAKVVLDFVTGSSIISVITHVSSAPRHMGATNISAALGTAQMLVASQGRPDAAKVVVLIADGRDSDQVALVMNLIPFKLTHVTFFAVGVGSQVDVAQLKEIASDPDCSHAFFVPLHQSLENFNMAIERISCRVPLVLGPGQYSYPCGFNILAQVTGGTIGASVTVSTGQYGAVQVFGSYTTQLPGPDVHDLNHTATASTPAVIFTRDLRPLTLSLESASHLSVTCVGNYSVKVDAQSAKRSVCNGRLADMAILLDITLTRTEADWTAMLTFVQALVQQFQVGSGSARIALLSFAETPILHFGLTQLTSAADILQALRTIPRPAPASTSNLAAALAFVHDYIFIAASGSRSEASKTLIVVTQGQPRDPVAALTQADSLHSLGTRIVVTAVGFAAFDDVTLSALASGPQHVHKVPELSALPPSVGMVVKEACGEVSVVCVEGGINRECHIEDLINMQYGNLLGPDRTVAFNPCALQLATGGAGGVHIDRFPHPDPDKFLLCDSSGQAYVVLCPLHELYSPRAHECQAVSPTTAPVLPQTTPPAYLPTATPYQPVFTTQPPTQPHDWPTSTPNHFLPLTTTSAPPSGNPCTPSAVISGLLFWPYTADPTKYYHCTNIPFVGRLESCPPDKIWNQAILNCIFAGVIADQRTNRIDPTLTNPCTSTNGGYFPVPNDPTGYIQCNAVHEAYLMHCSPGQRWYQDLQACSY